MRFFGFLLCLAVGGAYANGADDALRGAGRAVGSFGVGATDAILAAQPSWVTIAPRSKADCIKESGGELNNVYVRCRNGRQEYVRVDSLGNRRVLGERPIPVN